jgi:cytosine/adenosine deaminase-related metal-dependent hydrolase
MDSIDLIIEARWIVPVEPRGVVLENHAVAIDADRIVALMPTADARSRYAPRERVVLEEHALIPGLVNAHVHNPMTLMRGLADDLPLMRWLQEHIWPAEAKAIGPEFVRDGIELAVAEMLRGGTTCCNENYFFPDVQAATYRRLGFRAMVGLPVIEFPSAWAATRDEYFADNAVPAVLRDAAIETGRELIKVDRTAAVDGDGLATLALTGTLSLTFDKSDRAPVIPQVAQAMLSKLGDYLKRNTGAVRLVRT